MCVVITYLSQICLLLGIDEKSVAEKIFNKTTVDLYFEESLFLAFWHA